MKKLCLFTLLTAFFLASCNIPGINEKTNITGTVTEFGSDIPLADVQVYLYEFIGGGTIGSSGSTYLIDSTTTDSEGRYSFFSGESPTTFDLSFKKDQYFEVKELPNSLIPGNHHVVNQTLDPYGWINFTFKKINPSNISDFIEFNYPNSSETEIINSPIHQVNEFLTRGNDYSYFFYSINNDLDNVIKDSIYVEAFQTAEIIINY